MVVTSSGDVVLAGGDFGEEGVVLVVDPATGAVTATCTFPRGGIGGMALDEERDLLHVSTAVDPAEVLSIDTRTWTVTAVRDGGTSSGGVQVDTTTGTVYVVDSDNSELLVYPAE